MSESISDEEKQQKAELEPAAVGPEEPKYTGLRGTLFLLKKLSPTISIFSNV
jgi:hypothetical protein